MYTRPSGGSSGGNYEVVGKQDDGKTSPFVLNYWAFSFVFRIFLRFYILILAHSLENAESGVLVEIEWRDARNWNNLMMI